MGKISRRSKACDIPDKVKEKVWERDGHCCIICGSPYAMPNAHYIPRSQGGLGTEENVVTLCIKCHLEYDNGKMRKEYKQLIKEYLQSQYVNWDEDKLRFNKYYQ